MITVRVFCIHDPVWNQAYSIRVPTKNRVVRDLVKIGAVIMHQELTNTDLARKASGFKLKIDQNKWFEYKLKNLKNSYKMRNLRDFTTLKKIHYYAKNEISFDISTPKRAIRL